MLGWIFLYMLMMIVAAGICEFIQYLGKIYDGPWSSFVMDGDNFRFNYLSYTIGILLFLVILFFSYRFILKKKFETNTLYRYEKIVAVILVIFLSILMVVGLVAESILILGFTNNIGPDSMLWLTVLGWPAITMVFVLVNLCLDM